MTEGLQKHRTEAGKRSRGRGRGLEEFGLSRAKLMKAAQNSEVNLAESPLSSPGQKLPVKWWGSRGNVESKAERNLIQPSQDPLYQTKKTQGFPVVGRRGGEGAERKRGT